MHVVICEDEAEVASVIKKKLNVRYPDLEIDIYTSVEAFCDSCQNIDSFDVAVLDIMMPGKNGIQLAQELRNKGNKAQIIFLTGSETQVFEAFKVEALRYLLKPVDDDALYEAMDAAIEKISLAASKSNPSIFIKNNGALSKISVKDIVSAEIFNRKITIHTINDDFQYYGKMSDLLSKLGDGVYQPHRSYVINLNFIESYESHQIKLVGGQTAMISKKKYGEFVRTYARFIRR